MRQASLFDILAPEDPDESVGLAGVVPAIRAAMNRVAGKDEECRKQLVESINAVAKRENVALTRGGGKAIEKGTLDKWVQSGSDQGHAPSLEAIMCFCLATGDASPVKPMLKALGLEVIHKAELEDLEYGKICMAQRTLSERKRVLEAKKKTLGARR